MNSKNKNKNKNIIDGYKGIMDLDLTNVSPIYHKIIIEDHYNDIKLYKIYQNELKPCARYENTIERIQKSQQRTQEIINEQLNKIKQKQMDKYFCELKKSMN